MLYAKFLLCWFYLQIFLSPIFFVNAIAFSNEKVPSLHVLIATTGRSTLLQMLNSLENQLESSDHITVVFDAIDESCVYEKAAEKLTNFACSTTICMEPINLGYWGHGIRNKYNELLGDFIMHADDDDIYLPGAFSLIRQVVSQDLNALYIFQIVSGNEIISGNPIKYTNISTQSGAIPSCYNSKSYWEHYHGGDYAFYKKLSHVVPKIVYIDHVIYQFRPGFL